MIVRNNIQLRNYVTKNGMGLKNLKKQYALYGKEISIINEKNLFTVRLPFI